MFECYKFLRQLKIHSFRDSKLGSINEYPEADEEPYLKYMIQSLQITEFQLIDCTEFDFKRLKVLYKLPMVMFCVMTAFVGGLQNSFLRATTISLTIVDGVNMISTLVLLSITLFLTPLQMYLINKSIEFYDQVEVMPIYLTLLIFLNIFCGAVILDEYMMYTW